MFVGVTPMASPSIVDESTEVQQVRAAARTQVDAVWAALLAWLTPAGDQRRLWDIEQGLWQRLWTLGRALLALWLAHRRPCGVPRRIRGLDGRIYRWHGSRATPVKSIFGRLAVRRAFYVIGDGKHGDTYAPLDRELGLQPGGFSLLTLSFASYLSAQVAFGQVRSTLLRFWGWAPATKSLMKLVDRTGPLGRPFLQAQGAPKDDGEILVIEVDGKGAPMISDTEMSRRRRPHKKRPRGHSGRKWRLHKRRQRPRKRRNKGDKSKNARIATIGVIYSLRRTPDGIEGPIHKRIYATFRNTEALFVWLRGEANKRGYGTKRTVFLADGDRKLWRLQQQYFGKAEACIDWCHVVEKLWRIGQTLYKEGSQELKDWVSVQVAELRTGHSQRLVRRLRQLAPTLPGSGPGTKRQRMLAGIAYLKKNLGRMLYARLRRDGLPISTGVVEGTVRHLVGLRLDGP